MTAWILGAIFWGIAGTWFGLRKARGVEYVKAIFPLYLAIILANRAWAHPTVLGGGVLVGLAFCVVADYLLGKRDNSSVFIYGLAGFLLAYLSYGICFFSAVPWWRGSYGIAGVLLFTAIIQYRTFRALPKELKVPVLLYMGVVSFLVLAAGNYAIQTQRYLSLGGAFLIYFSDSLIAHNLFRNPLPKSDLWILPPYYLGQVLIVITALNS